MTEATTSPRNCPGTDAPTPIRPPPAVPSDATSAPEPAALAAPEAAGGARAACRCERSKGWLRRSPR